MFFKLYQKSQITTVHLCPPLHSQMSSEFDPYTLLQLSTVFGTQLYVQFPIVEPPPVADEPPTPLSPVISPVPSPSTPPEQALDSPTPLSPIISPVPSPSSQQENTQKPAKLSSSHFHPYKRAVYNYKSFLSYSSPAEDLKKSNHLSPTTETRKRKRPTDNTGRFHRDVHRMIRKNGKEKIWQAFRAHRVCSMDRWPCVRRYKVFKLETQISFSIASFLFLVLVLFLF